MAGAHNWQVSHPIKHGDTSIHEMIITHCLMATSTRHYVRCIENFNCGIKASWLLKKLRTKEANCCFTCRLYPINGNWYAAQTKSGSVWLKRMVIHNLKPYLHGRLKQNHPKLMTNLHGDSRIFPKLCMYCKEEFHCNICISCTCISWYVASCVWTKTVALLI